MHWTHQSEDKEGMNGLKNKTKLNMLPSGNSPHCQEKHELNVRGWKMIHQENDIQKKMGVSHTHIRQNRLQVKKKKETGYKNHHMTVGSLSEALRPWQRSWGRRLGISKGRIEPQESPWKFLSIYPQNQSLPTFCFVLSPTPLTLWGLSPTTSLWKKELTYSSS